MLRAACMAYCWSAQLVGPTQSQSASGYFSHVGECQEGNAEEGYKCSWGASRAACIRQVRNATDPAHSHWCKL
eukprot:2542178-Amphidinium_carterae.2